jgi:hypothetical protein
MTKRFILLILIMTAVAAGIGVAAIAILYHAALDEERSRLVETAQSQARLMEAVARFDEVYSLDYPEGSKAATIAQIKDAHERYLGFGETGEFTLARRVGDDIVFVLRHRHLDMDKPQPVPFDSNVAEPMRRALSGQSGTTIGLDYRGAGPRDRSQDRSRRNPCPFSKSCSHRGRYRHGAHCIGHDAFFSCRQPNHPADTGERGEIPEYGCIRSGRHHFIG